MNAFAFTIPSTTVTTFFLPQNPSDTADENKNDIYVPSPAPTSFFSDSEKSCNIIHTHLNTTPMVELRTARWIAHMLDEKTNTRAQIRNAKMHLRRMQVGQAEVESLMTVVNVHDEFMPDDVVTRVRFFVRKMKECRQRNEILRVLVQNEKRKVEKLRESVVRAGNGHMI